MVSWEVYKQIHPTESIRDYRKLLTHELGHLLHIAVLKDKEEKMGPIWFFEGLACLMANQYPDAKLPGQVKIRSILRNNERGNYREYVAIVRALNKSYSIRDLIQRAC